MPHASRTSPSHRRLLANVYTLIEFSSRHPDETWSLAVCPNGRQPLQIRKARGKPSGHSQTPLSHPHSPPCSKVGTAPASPMTANSSAGNRLLFNPCSCIAHPPTPCAVAPPRFSCSARTTHTPATGCALMVASPIPRTRWTCPVSACAVPSSVVQPEGHHWVRPPLETPMPSVHTLRSNPLAPHHAQRAAGARTRVPLYNQWMRRPTFVVRLLLGWVSSPWGFLSGSRRAPSEDVPRCVARRRCTRPCPAFAARGEHVATPTS